MRQFSGLAFRSPLHARVPRNLEERALKAMRSVARKVGTWGTTYHRLRAADGDAIPSTVSAT